MWKILPSTHPKSQYNSILQVSFLDPPLDKEDWPYLNVLKGFSALSAPPSRFHFIHLALSDVLHQVRVLLCKL